MKYTYTTPPGTLLKSNITGIINNSQFNALPLTAAAIGYNADGPIYIDIASAPHVLIAGTTGSGKSVMMHNIIVSLLYKNTPADAEFYMMDPKMVELSLYENIPIVTRCDVDPRAALATLAGLHHIMMARYKILKSRGARHASAAGMKEIYVFIDELADLMFYSKKETEKYISCIARLGRAAGIHLIIATQRPTRDILTGQIKLNIPCRVALAVPAAVDSVVILGHKGAETLRGRGDALLKLPDAINEIHFQGSFISDAELKQIIDYCERQRPKSRGLFSKLKTG